MAYWEQPQATRQDETRAPSPGLPTTTHRQDIVHEYGITESLLSIVEQKAEEAGVEKVETIRIVIGVLTGFAPESIQFYFGPMSRDTVAEGAILEFEELPVKLRCRACGSVFEPDSRTWTCPDCNSSEVDISGGREIYVKEMEVS